MTRVPGAGDCGSLRRVRGPQVVRRPGFEPWHLRVVSAPAGDVVAMAEAGHRGTRRCELSTDSRTGALGLYEKVGRRVASTWVNRAIDL